MGKRLGAWLLTLVMVLSLVVVPAKTVQATTASVASGSSSLELSYLTDAYDTTAELKAAGYTKLEVVFSVSGYTDNDTTDEATPGVQTFYNGDSGWISGTWNNLSDCSAKTTSVVDFSKALSTDSQVYSFGLQFVNVTGNVEYTIQSVTLKGDGVSDMVLAGGSSSGDSGSTDSSTDFGTEREYSSGVSVTISNQGTPSSDWSGFDMSMNNNTGSSICDWIVKLQVPEGTASAFKCWNATFVADGDIIYLYPMQTGVNAVIASGALTDNIPGGGFASKYVDASSIQVLGVYFNKGDSSSIDYSGGDTNDETGGSGSSGSSATDTVTNKDLDVEFNYAKALQESLYFYDANMCGKLKGTCGLNWRGNCHTYDANVTTTINGVTYTVDASGGFHDAGDHVKFGLPQGYAASVLGMSYYQFSEAFTSTGQAEHLQKITDYFCDYFKRCTVYDSTGNVVGFCYQVGDGGLDHAEWSAPEGQTMSRPAYFATSSNPATDEVSVAIAALALNYINFGNTEDLQVAKDLFTFVQSNSKACAQGSEVSGFYYSSSWKDDYGLAAAALYTATKESSYLSEYTSQGYVNRYWVMDWENSGALACMLMNDTSSLSGVVNAGKNCSTIDGVFNCVSDWGSCRYNAASGFVGMVYDKLTGTSTYDAWAVSQMNYMLGDNPNKRCFIVGYNENSSQYPHHRAASRSSDAGTVVENHYTLLGALVGGPGQNGTYQDLQSDYYCNEVALDYNAGLVGLAAGLYCKHKDDTSTYLSYANETTTKYGTDLATAEELSAVGVTGYYGATTDSTAVSKVTLDKTTLALKKTGTATLTATVSPDTAEDKTVTWTSSDETVATVNSAGTVTAVANGTATITATAGTKKATCTVTVTTDVTSVTLNKTVATIIVGQSDTITATISPSDASNQNLTWTSNNTAVATVNSTGTVTAVAEGTATITATTKDGTNLSATCEVMVKPVPAAKLTVSDTSIILSQVEYGYSGVTGKSLTISNTGDAATTTFSLSFKNGSSSKFTLDTLPGGSQLAVGGTFSTTLKMNEGLAAGTYTDTLVVSYDSKTIEIPVSATVTKRAITITATSIEKEYGAANPELLWSITSGSQTAGDNLNVVCSTTAGTSSDVGEYPITVTAWNTNYDITTVAGTLTVVKKTVNDLLFPTTSEIKVGQKLLESGLSGGSTQYGTFAWENGEMTPARGTQSLNVVLTLNDNAKKNYAFSGYEVSAAGTITKAVSVNVLRGDLPSIVAPSTVTIAYGETLTDSLLVGGSTEYGSFAWENANMTPTAVGTYQYSVIFTWSDAMVAEKGLEEDEKTLSYDVTVVVTKAVNNSKPVATAVTGKTSNSITVETVTGQEYSLDGKTWIQSGLFTGLSAFTGYRIYTRIAETDTHQASETEDSCVTYTYVADPYVIDVSKLSNSNYVDALKDAEGNATVNYYQENGKIYVSLVNTGKAYTITGKNTDVCVVATDVGTITLQNATIREMQAGAGIKNIVLVGNVIVSDGLCASDTIAGGTASLVISGTGILTTETITASGDLTISGGRVTVENGISAGGTLTIQNVDLEVNVEEGSNQNPISSDNIVILGENTITSNSDADTIYSSTPKDENGNEVAFYDVYYLDEDGKTTLDVTEEIPTGSKVTLPEMEEEEGYISAWKDMATGKVYQPNVIYVVTGDITFIVYRQKIKVTKITLDSKAETIEVGDGVTLTETVTPENAYDTGVVWSSSNAKVATVDQEGEVTGVAPGTALITAKAKDGSGVYATCKVTVISGEPEEVEVERIQITGATKKVAPGKKLKLKATVYPDNATNQKVKWKVSNKKYASVSSAGVVTTKKAGKGKTVTVTAYSAEDDSIKATYKISIMKNAVKKIKLSAKTKTIKKGKSVTIKAKFTPSKGISKELTWTSSNKKIATVNAKGKVTGKKKGTVKITAKAKDGSGKKATIKIRVK